MQPVLHVGKARVGVVVQGKDVCLGVQLLQALHDAAAHHVVGQASEGLQDDEVVHAVRRVVHDLGGDEHALAGVEGVVDHLVAGARHVAQARRALVEGMCAGNAVTGVVRQVEDLVCHAPPGLLQHGLVELVLAHLGVHVEVGLLDDVAHLGLDDLHAVALQIELDVAVGAGVEVEQVLAHDEHARAGVRAVVGHLVHLGDCALEASLAARHAACAHAVDDVVHAALERRVGGACRQLVGADLAQQLLEGVDHGEHGHDAHRAAQAEGVAGLDVVRVLVVVAHDGDVVVACVVKRPAQERHVVREAAVAHVLGHGDGNLMRVVLARLHRRQRLADHDLRREADVVVHVLLAQANGLLAAHLQRRRLELGACHGGRHDARERVRGVGHEDGLVGVLARELARVGIA